MFGFTERWWPLLYCAIYIKIYAKIGQNVHRDHWGGLIYKKIKFVEVILLLKR